MRFLMLFLILITAIQLNAHNFLVVQRTSSPKQVKYAPGDEIGVKVKGDNYVHYGELVAINDSIIVVGDQRILISEIIQIRDRRRVPAFRTMAISSAASVPFFLLVTSANNLFNTGDRPLVDDQTWAMSGIFAGISAALWSIGPKKYRIGKRWKLVSLNTSFGP